MRWFFLLLLLLNGFYYIWHQQEAPLRAKEIMPLAMQRNHGQEIRLVSETEAHRPALEVASDCLYLGDLRGLEQIKAVEQRLKSLDIESLIQASQGNNSQAYWLRIAPDSERLVGDGLIAQLTADFPLLKRKIMSCESIASPN